MPFLSTIWFLLLLVFLNQPAAWAKPLRNAAERPTVSELAAPLHSYNFGLDLISQDRNVAGNWVESFYGYDGHGSTRYLTDAAGSVTDEYSYDAYGTLLTTSGSTVNPYLYCGEQFDADLGLYYLRARYLNQDSGRFWTQDTFEGFGTDPISLHKYLYAHANPINGSDPSGKSFLAEAYYSVGARLWTFAQTPIFTAIKIGGTAVTFAMLAADRDFLAVYLMMGGNPVAEGAYLVGEARAMATALVRARAVAEPTAHILGELDVVVGLVKDNKVVRFAKYGADPFLAPSHEMLAKQADQLIKPGVLGDGIEAFTVVKQNGKVLIRGSNNFNVDVKPETKAYLENLFQ